LELQLFDQIEVRVNRLKKSSIIYIMNALLIMLLVLLPLIIYYAVKNIPPGGDKDPDQDPDNTPSAVPQSQAANNANPTRDVPDKVITGYHVLDNINSKTEDNLDVVPTSAPHLDCTTKCNDNPKCGYFVYDKKQKTCNLKPVVNDNCDDHCDDKQIEDDINYQIYYKIREPSKHYTRIANLGTDGYDSEMDIIHDTDSSIQSCFDKCDGNVYCSFFVRTGDSRCHFYGYNPPGFRGKSDPKKCGGQLCSSLINTPPQDTYSVYIKNHQPVADYMLIQKLQIDGGNLDSPAYVKTCGVNSGVKSTGSDKTPAEEFGTACDAVNNCAGFVDLYGTDPAQGQCAAKELSLIQTDSKVNSRFDTYIHGARST